ncbi:hypothetical protein N9E85_00595 [Gammaproteobacteria bacterium]|nr:hypothetical protein [Gammaproteobacteria bacterium]
MKNNLYYEKMKIDNISLDNSLREITEKIDSIREDHHLTSVEDIFKHGSPLILEACIHLKMGTLIDFLPHSVDFEPMHAKQKPLNLNKLQEFLAWILAEKNPAADQKSFEMGITQDNNNPIHDYILPLTAPYQRDMEDLPGDEKDSEIEKKHKILEFAIKKGYVDKLNSNVFWAAYIQMSQFLEQKTDAANKVKIKNALDLHIKKIIKAIDDSVSSTNLNSQNLDNEQLKDIFNKIISNENFLPISTIDECQSIRRDNFLNFVKKPDDFKQDNKNPDLKNLNFRWDYKSTLQRGIYHTTHCWAERNILARCMLILHGINPYSTNRSAQKKTDPAQKGAFELKSLISMIETKVARWNASEMYAAGITKTIECLKKIIDIFEIYSLLHKQYKLQAAEDGSVTVPHSVNLYFKQIPNEYTQDNLISLNQLALITGLKSTTILNESKQLEKYREDHHHQLHENEFLTTVPKKKIKKDDRKYFDSRCFDLASVLDWIMYKNYHTSKDTFKRIPLKFINHDKDFDYGLLEILSTKN